MALVKSENRLATWVILEILFNGFGKSPRVLRSSWIFEWIQFVLQNCEILYSVRGLHPKNSASWYCFTSDVMHKKYKRLVYTSPDLWARFCKANLSNAKNSAWFVSRPILLRSRAIMAVKCDRRWLLSFRCTYKAISSM